MKTMTTKAHRRGLTAIAIAGAALLGSACSVDELLEVNNPAELNEELLQDSTLVNVLLNGVIGDFQAAYSDPFIWRGSMFTDQQITGINWEQTARLSQRVVRFDEGDADLMFSDLSRARAQADSVAGRFRTLLATPSADERMATALAYAGYSYILLADAMCEATVNVGSEIYEPLQLYQFAVDRLDEALSIAQTAGDDEIANLARVGLSRAHLNLGNDAEVLAIAQQVPEEFRRWVEYSDTDPRTYNILEARVTGANHSLGMHPHFLAGGPDNFGEQDLEPFLTDPRVQHLPDWRLGHNRLTQLYTPKQGLMFSEYNGETFANGGTPPDFLQGTDITFASGLEARHNYYEALGPSQETLDFVNERRAVGNQAPVTLSGDELMMELRDQRGRDLFLSGHRLGDLRRWLREGDNMFPQGQHPNEQWGDYGTATCYPMPLEEYEGNPNVNVPS
ncbi:MAG: hypothetical protein R3E98_01540 [Gemmatimonadota bacterium]|nr:hypothetical protein [Gemmatimonadota bacterium]